MRNRERFELALNATIYSTYCLNVPLEKIKEDSRAFTDKVSRGEANGGLSTLVTAACRVLEIDATNEAIRRYVTDDVSEKCLRDLRGYLNDNVPDEAMRWGMHALLDVIEGREPGTYQRKETEA